ncbi:HET-domain-containing protein, partial [Byssothecium circinans]
TWDEDGIPSIEIDVWADIGTQKALSTTPPIKSYGGRETIDLVYDWLSTCYRNHAECRRSLSGAHIEENSRLIPADRILDIGTEPSDPIKLVKAIGLKGRYCALSHCWGSPDGPQPTRVILANEKRFMEGVQCPELSKTFQDTVHIVRSLGIRYLWIDSLCIIQDSAEHWLRESKRMGLIYEGAYLRIAAAGAQNSSEGLFSPEDHDNPKYRTISIPLLTGNNGGNPDCIYLRRSKPRLKWPRDGPLVKRAWVFQEWFLSRRTVSFMLAYLNWSCKRHSSHILRYSQLGAYVLGALYVVLLAFAFDA